MIVNPAKSIITDNTFNNETVELHLFFGLYSFISPFLNFCKIEKKLNVIGLMCIPPIDKPSEIYFKK
jgi:hypothetical protein